ncbi:MAG TPA: hypothetical protein VMZ90_09230 [Vicinamibacterales bacterium]|nr:hypothetical protein [Vicinamibacterales bacterium]
MSRNTRALALAVGALMVIAVVVTARRMSPIVTSSDLAITEFYTELATRGELLAGPYSRFGWNHPGPIYFYVLAPFYAAGGHRAAALFAAAVAINLAAIFILTWVVSREDRGPFLVLVTIACLVIAWRVPRLLASPWTAHIPVLASIGFVVVCGAVIGGRYRLLPLLIVFGSFITQTHLSYVPMVGVLSSVAIAGVLVGHRRQAAAVLRISAGLWVLLWLPTIIEASMNRGGNIAELWRFFVANGTGYRATAESIANWSDALNGILRPDLTLPWGGHFVPPPSGWRLPLAMGQVVGLWFVSWSSIRESRRVESGIAACAALATMVGFWSITRIQGDILDHELLGLVALGALNLAILGSALLRVVRPKAWRWHEQAATSASIAALVACTVVGIQHFRVFTSFELRRTDTARIPASYDLLRDSFDQLGIRRPLFRMDGDAVSDGTGILLRLLQTGRPFAVEEGTGSVVGNKFRKTGEEDALVNLSAREGLHLSYAARPGNIVVRDRNPLFVDLMPVRPK